ncbi:MAG: endonuclease MutS2, partial [Vampirovibrionia bacterium]
AELEFQDFIDVRSTLMASKALKGFFAKHKEAYPKVNEIASLLLDQDSLITELDRCFDKNGNLLNTASPQLKQLKDSHRDQVHNLKSILNSILHSDKISKYLQEPVFTIRNERYVLPVKAEHKSDVPGIVHDSSASGVTIFIEPRSIVDLNNKVKEIELKIEHEIQRILAKLAQSIANNAKRIYIILNLLSELDLIFAKAKYSALLDAGEPEINESKIIDLKLVRHPILLTTIDKVIANTVNIGDEYNSLIITGANTGGKTVMLKSIGLCVLMAGAGMHIPADVGSSIHLFGSVFADIGEEQSLEHNLSTFSAKMTNIINIVIKSDSDSLVLLDELGAGTDPAEGTALAQSILEHLYVKSATTAVTTHYGGLKTLAFTNKAFVNASVEFDIETLSPTYRLLMGIPGKSNAMTIAKNLGLPDNIVNRSREIYNSSVDDVSVMIEELQKMQHKIVKELDKAEKSNKQAQGFKIQYEDLLERLNSSKSNALNSYKHNLNKELNKAKSEVLDIMTELKNEKTDKSAKKAHSELAKVGYNAKQTHDKYKERLEKKKSSKPINWDTIEIGDKVKIKKLGQIAEILSMPDSSNRITVQMGMIKSTVKTSDVELVEKTKKEVDFSPKFDVKGSVTKTRREDITMNCDLRGKRVDDAIQDLELFLDKSALANVSAIYVVHGHGTGALRKAIREFLKESPYVKAFRSGEQSEGGDGVSIVELV